MNTARYILQPYKGMNTRHRCPGCQHRDKTFSVYIDAETGKQIHPDVGRCNRESNCGYHYTPKQYFVDTGLGKVSFALDTRARAKCSVVTPTKVASFISAELFEASLKGYTRNNFVRYLVSLFGAEVASQLIGRYFIGSSKHWPGSTVFWQIDAQGKIRTGKIMLYNPDTGKRVKEPYNCITWVHKALKMADFELKQALFGEHLFIDKAKPIALVESEKTAVIACGYLPQFIWLAVGSLSNLSAERCEVLKGRAVVLFPDLNGFEKWKAKVKELSNIATFTISDLLERKAAGTERQQGLDLADYLIKFDFKLFAAPKPLKPAQVLPPYTRTDTNELLLNSHPSLEQSEPILLSEATESRFIVENQDSNNGLHLTMVGVKELLTFLNGLDQEIIYDQQIVV